MSGLIDKLKRLQQIDGEIQKLQQEKNRWPVIIEEKRKDVGAVNETLAAKQEELKEAKVEVDGLELKLNSGEALIGKCKTTLLTVKTNREYEAILREIEGHKGDNSMIEEQIIRGYDHIEGIEAEVREIEGAVREAEAEVSQVEKTAGKEIDEIVEEIDELESERTEALEGLSEDVLAQYKRIAGGREGLAIVPVIDDVCQGCFVTLTSQQINSLLMADDSLITCRKCQRIMYIEK